MKKLVFLLLLVCASTILSMAQNNGNRVTVTGKVIDGDDKTPVGQATVQLLSLPDSAMVVGKVTDNNGFFSIAARPGKYILKVSFVGYLTQEKPLQLSLNKPVNLGTIVLPSDAIMLGEAVVVAEAPQVTAVEDTLMYNSSAYRTPEGAMLEELVKKLPGAEVDDEGNIKINGKDIKKIMVDGKEFFGGDVKTGLKNLPVDLVDKLKTYDKKSDLARITGIDDGEEETVLDLTVKKGMNQGWFGNVDLGIGTKDRYTERLMLNRFVDKTQFSIVGSANNVNDQGFSGGGGGPRWGRSNGLNAKKMLGANFATETSKLEMGGSVRFNYSDADMVSTSYSESFQNKSFNNTNSIARNKVTDLNADFRMEWKPDSMTNIIFRPNVSYSKSKNASNRETGTFNEDPFKYVENPNDYLNFDQIGTSDPLKDIRVNSTNSQSLSDSKNTSANASLQYNRKLNNKGRNVTIRGSFGYGNNDNDQYVQSETRYYQLLNNLGQDSILYRNQYIAVPTKNYSYGAQFTYSEPIARATFLQFSYNFQYKYSKSDKSTYDLNDFPWNIGNSLPQGYESAYVDSLSKDAEYKYFNHEISLGLRIIREKYQMSAGVSLQPQNTKLSYKKGTYMVDTTRNVFNFAPNLDFRYRFSKVSQLRVTYRGRSNQPNMENLLPIVDNSDPLNIRVGNPGLKPSFNHTMRAFYNTYNAERQQGMMAHLSFTATQNAISNSSQYNETTGVKIITPDNINGNWNAFAMYGFNTALKNKKYTINTFTRANYQNQVAFQYNNALKEDLRNRTTGLTLAENLNASYRNNWFEFSLNGSIEYNWERNKLNPSKNQEPYTYSYGASTNITLPWSMTLSTNMINQCRRGYSDSSLNRNELIWNAQIAQNILKGAATISFEMYDILKQQTTVTRTLTANERNVSDIYGINSYCMAHFIYRLNIFGSKAARDKMMNRRGGFGAPGFGPGGGGHGRHPF